jgi:hypothetical protein
MRDVSEGQISEFVRNDAQERTSHAAKARVGIVGSIGGFFGIPTELTAAGETFLIEGLNLAALLG